MNEPVDSRTKWDNTYATSELDPLPSAILREYEAILPVVGTGMDVAGGTGRNALWLAQRGLDMTLVDISAVGLARAETWAAERGLAITTIERDVERDGVPPGPWQLVVSTYFLDRRLLASLPGLLAPGGIAVFCHPTAINLQRHPRPSGRFLLAEGELAILASTLVESAGVKITDCSETWRANDRHEAWLVLRLP